MNQECNNVELGIGNLECNNVESENHWRDQRVQVTFRHQQTLYTPLFTLYTSLLNIQTFDFFEGMDILDFKKYDLFIWKSEVN